MQKKILVSCIAVACAVGAIAAATISTPHIGVNVSGDAGGPSYNFSLDNNEAPTNSAEYVESVSKVYRDNWNLYQTTFQYTKVKAYENGLCALNANGTIQKLEAFSSLSSIRIQGADSGRVLVKTSFNSDFSNEYSYNYTLSSTNPLTLTVVGNYLKIVAVDEVSISSIMFSYNCGAEEESATTGVQLRDEENYAYLENGDDGNTYLFTKLKVTNGRSLVKEDLTLRNSDNLDEFATTCKELTAEQGEGNYLAKFSMSSLNWHSGLWTQYTYPARIYVNNKRIDNAENGNVYVTGQTLDTGSVLKNNADENAATCGYKLGLTEWPGGGVVTVSWTNNVNEGAYFTNKGVRFAQLGSDGKTIYNHTMAKHDEQVYFYLYGWVRTIEEAELISGRYERFSLRNATGTSTIELNVAANPNYCSYEAAENGDGYKVTLAFNIDSLRDVVEGKSTGYFRGNVIAGLYYDGIPYMYRDSGNTGGLRTAQSLNTDNDAEFCWKGREYYYYRAHNFYNWILLRAIHA